MTKFEVGKKYQYEGGYVEECLAVTDDVAWLKSPSNRGWLVDRVHTGWKEVKEPRTLSRWLNVWEDADGELRLGVCCKTKEQATGAVTIHDWKRIDTIEVSYTEKV